MTVREEAQWCIQQDGMLAEIRKKIRSGKATYEDTAAYSARAGKMIGALFSRRLPEIPPEEREQLCVELLHDQYIDINAAVDAAQRYLDERLGIQLAPQHAPFDAERGHQIGSSLRDLSKPVETLQRRAKAATETTVKSMHDDRMKSEAKFRSRAGLKCFITRKAVSGCCAWCTAMAGRFEYGEEPDDIYRRHDNCDCTVTFENGRKRQDVWSKREWEAPEPGAGAGERVVLTAEQARELEAKHQPEVLTKGSKPAIIKLPDIEIGRSVGAKAKNYDIMDLETGEHFSLAKGTSLRNVQVFAGKGVKKPYAKAWKYAKKFGGRVEDWQHAKGIGTVDFYGEYRDAELHWSQCDGYGKHDFFIKRWLE